MKPEPNEKGKELENVVEHYLRLMGKKYKRNVRIRGISGALHEIDFLVLLEGYNKEIIEVKNLSKPVNKDIIMKVAEVADDIGAYRGTVISSNGFTTGALKMARKLNITLIDLEDILKSIRVLKEPLDVTKFSPLYSPKDSLKYIKRFLKGPFFFKMENVEDIKCVEYPFYEVRAIRRSKKRNGYHTELGILFSAYSGLPVALTKEKFREVGDKISSLPPDILEVIQRVQGKKVCRKEFVNQYGESVWKRVVNVIKTLKIGDLRKEGRNVCIKMPKIVPDIKFFILAEHSLKKNNKLLNQKVSCKIVEPKTSPGLIKLLSETLLSLSVINIKLLYLPLYRIKIIPKRGPRNKYRYIYLAAWIKKAIEYLPTDDLVNI